MKRFLIMGIVAFSMFLVGCSDNGGGQTTLDKAGEVAGDAAEATKDAAGEAMEYTGDKMQEAGESMSETGQSMQSPE